MAEETLSEEDIRIMKLREKEAIRAKRDERRQQAKLERIEATKQMNFESSQRASENRIKVEGKKIEKMTLQEQMQLRKAQRHAIAQKNAAIRKRKAKARAAFSKLPVLPRINPAARVRAIRTLTTQPEGIPPYRVFGEENSTIINPSREKLRFYGEKREGIVKKSVKQMRWL
jgi:hypothetical protein